MAGKRLEERLKELIKPVVEKMGYELWGLQWLPASRILRIYIDLPGGVALQDCEQVSRKVSRLLDIEDPIPFAYHLEVSSPGWDRPLFTLDQFRRFLGSAVRLTTQEPISGRRRFKGILARVEGEEIVLDEEGRLVTIPFGQIEKARLLPESFR